MSKPDCISVTDLADFRERYAKPRRPVVIRGLFERTLLGRIRTQAQAREQLGHVPVQVLRNYMDQHLSFIQDIVAGRRVEVAFAPATSTLAELLERLERAPEERWIASENLPAPDLLEGIDLSVLGITDIEAGPVDRSMKFGPGTAVSRMFVAGPGNASDLHTDWDGHNVVLYQVFGRKRAVVFPTSAAPQLMPIGIYSTLRLRDLDDTQRAALVESLGGVEVVLEPGDALFMPAFCWHHLDYLDVGMSVNFRFDAPQDEDVCFLIRRLHCDTHTQNLLASVLDEESSRRHKSSLVKLRQAYEKPYPTPEDKYRAMQAVAVEAYREICLGNKPYVPPTWLTYSELLLPTLSRLRYPATEAATAA